MAPLLAAGRRHWYPRGMKRVRTILLIVALIAGMITTALVLAKLISGWGDQMADE